MSEEIKIEEEKKCNCFCQSKGFRKFLTIALGTFVGVYTALCLFTAIHKPPMPVFMPAPCPCQQMMHRPNFEHHHFNRGYRDDFHKKMMPDKQLNHRLQQAQEVDD